jgi:hypothetical protein
MCRLLTWVHKENNSNEFRLVNTYMPISIKIVQFVFILYLVFILRLGFYLNADSS